MALYQNKMYLQFRESTHFNTSVNFTEGILLHNMLDNNAIFLFVETLAHSLKGMMFLR